MVEVAGSSPVFRSNFNSKPMMEPITTTIQNCARCGGTHASLEFNYLTNSVGPLNRWSICPKSGEPILMRVEQVDPKAPHLPAPIDVLGLFAFIFLVGAAIAFILWKIFA